MARPNASCIAWWYLTCGPGHAHCFVGVFVHAVRDEFIVEIAEGKSSMVGFPKDDHITKPGWSFGASTLPKTTQREALGRALKYADGIANERQHRGFKLEEFCFSPRTGTAECEVMQLWQTRHDGQKNLTLDTTPRPEWWPTRGHLYMSFMDARPQREKVHKEGFDLVALINSASSKQRRKRKGNGRITRRVGRFTVYAKGT